MSTYTEKEIARINRQHTAIDKIPQHKRLEILLAMYKED